MFFGYTTLLVAFILSGVAAYYSVLGLTAIFSAAFWPVVIMGGALEIGKIITAMWLHKNWHRCGLTYKAYLLPSLLFLMLLTSMGTFGFLSKAHSNQGLLTGDAQSQLVLLDEKLKIERENIDAAKRALNQLDQTVEQTIARSSGEDSVIRAASLRRSQQKERQELQRDITNAQGNITRINQERAPIAAKYREIEAEIGPIKYVGALMYGDNPDKNLLEKAVRWVIILIVVVFDPLAIVLILAGARHLEWTRQDLLNQKLADASVPSAVTHPDVIAATPEIESTDASVPPVMHANIVVTTAAIESTEDTIDSNITSVAANVASVDQSVSQVSQYSDSDISKLNTFTDQEPEEPEFLPETVNDNIVDTEISNSSVITSNVESVSTENSSEYRKIADEYYDINGKTMHMRVIKDSHPKIYTEILQDDVDQTLKPIADNVAYAPKSTFGVNFPSNPERGEIFLNVATLPSKLYKFNGIKWIIIDKNTTDSYIYDDEYLKFLIGRMSAGILSPDDLTISEQDQITEYLKKWPAD